MRPSGSTGPGCKLVVAHPDRKAQRALQRLLGATLCPVEVVADADALLAAMDPTSIAVVDSTLAHARPDVRGVRGRAWIAVPGEGLAPADPAALDALLVAGWQHVVSHPMPLLAEELLATVQKLIRGDLFGLEKYMAWGAEMRSYVLEDARERDDAVAMVARDVVAVGLPDRISSLASVIADELLANAIYAAPIDDGGVRPRQGEPRDKFRGLTGRDAVSLRWATDGRYFGIEVRDGYGSIQLPPIPTRLSTSAKPTSSEAGMGLPLVYACCNQLVIGVAPGESTEVIALLDVRYKPTELGRCASFHTFTRREPGT